MSQTQIFGPAEYSILHIRNFNLIISPDEETIGLSNYQLELEYDTGCHVLTPQFNPNSNIWRVVTYGQPNHQLQVATYHFPLGRFSSTSVTFQFEACEFPQQPQNLVEHDSYYSAQSMQGNPTPLTAKKRRKTIVYNQPIIHKSIIHKIIKWLSKVFGLNS